MAGKVDYGNNGYVGTWLCDANGVFQTPPIVTLSFSKSYPDIIPGLTITWSTVYNEWAVKYRVKAYHSGRIVFIRDGLNDAVQTILSSDISEYDTITIEILEWSKPYRRARVEDVFLGIEKTYRKPDIMSFRASMSVDPLSAELPKSEITFELKNLNGEYNLDNPNSTQKYLMERQELSVRYGYRIWNDIEWIDAGTYYLSEWETPQNGITASFTARDALEFMTDTYSGITAGTFMEIAQAAFEQANLPKLSDGGSRWFISASLNNLTVPASAAEELRKSSIAEVLQYLANAACCVFYQDRGGVIRIEPLTYSIEDYGIDMFNSYANSEITLSKQLRAINVNNGQYILPVGRKGETQPISNPLISDSQAILVSAWAADFLQNRRTYSGSFRADPRLDPLDMVKNENQYAAAMVLITSVNYTYNGAFRGSFEGVGIDNAMTVFLHSGEPLAICGLTIPGMGG